MSFSKEVKKKKGHAIFFLCSLQVQVGPDIVCEAGTVAVSSLSDDFGDDQIDAQVGGKHYLTLYQTTKFSTSEFKAFADDRKKMWVKNYKLFMEG